VGKGELVDSAGGGDVVEGGEGGERRVEGR